MDLFSLYSYERQREKICEYNSTQSFILINF